MSGVLIASWAGCGILVGAALAIWTRRFLTSNPRGLLRARPTAPLLTATLFGILAWRLGDHFDLLPYSYLAAVGVPLAVIDAVEQRLPSTLVFAGIAGLGVLFAISAVVHSSGMSFLRALGGMAILAAFYLVLALASGGGLGAGDVKLGGLLGLSLGWMSWSAILAATFLGWFLAAIVWFLFRATRRASPGSLLPMGPFLLLGALISISVLPT
ncbi:MAG: pilD [Amycolatopsis sp.]|uniref:prepilin peptidase n=1 Tax=Amycolatopsis sp. TaxID=37632 RepID=UPI00262B5B49|nr:prepilin peptidase [Amycolatopsis sp.]MCU1680233.1 pilD [Amycolatopsis sp.]